MIMEIVKHWIRENNSTKRYEEEGIPLQELWEHRNTELQPESARDNSPNIQPSLVKTMYGPTTPGYMGPITPNYGPGSHIYQSPLTPGYDDNPPDLNYNSSLSTGPSTPTYGSVYTPQYSSMPLMQTMPTTPCR